MSRNNFVDKQCLLEALNILKLNNHAGERSGLPASVEALTGGGDLEHTANWTFWACQWSKLAA